jgi:hypothetical protein
MSKDSRFPAWAPNRFEFVYEARKMFESQGISLVIHEWIDRVFSCLGARGPSKRSTSELPIEYELKFGLSVQASRLLRVKRDAAIFRRFRFDRHFYSILLEHQRSNLACKYTQLASVDCQTTDFVFAEFGHLYGFSQSRLASERMLP